MRWSVHGHLHVHVGALRRGNEHLAAAVDHDKSDDYDTVDAIVRCPQQDELVCRTNSIGYDAASFVTSVLDRGAEVWVGLANESKILVFDPGCIGVSREIEVGSNVFHVRTFGSDLDPRLGPR